MKPTAPARQDAPPPEPAAEHLTVVLARHGQASGMAPIQQLGPPLTGLGRRQVAALARRLAAEKFSHIYSSPLVRAMQTAAAIRRYHQRTRFTVSPELVEVTFYQFSDVPVPPKQDIRRLIRRERAAMETFVRHIRRVHKPGEKILLVCHGNLIRCLMALLGGKDPKESVLVDMANSALAVVDVWPNGEAVVRLANCVKHLSPRQVTT